MLKEGKPVVLQLVDENKRAWHAGVSSWNGRNNLNDSSVGIEIVNPGYTENMMGKRTWYPYKEKQIEAIAALAKDIIHRYQITPIMYSGTATSLLCGSRIRESCFHGRVWLRWALVPGLTSQR